MSSCALQVCSEDRQLIGKTCTLYATLAGRPTGHLDTLRSILARVTYIGFQAPSSDHQVCSYLCMENLLDSDRRELSAVAGL